MAPDAAILDLRGMLFLAYLNDQVEMSRMSPFFFLGL